ncbi:MAG: N-formylglutamate amidohydrolase [Candidatus Njordarchaeia archaeon]
MVKISVLCLEGPLKNIPVAVICEEISGNSPFIKMIYQTGEHTIPVVQPETPEVERFYGKKFVRRIKNCESLLVSSAVMSKERLKEGDIVKVEAARNNLFLYDTNLSIHYNFKDPEMPKIQRGKNLPFLLGYKKLKAYIIGYKLFWKKGDSKPTIVKSRYNSLIGELYLGLNEADLRRAEEYFLKEKKKLIHHPVMPIDLNFSGKFIDSYVSLPQEGNLQKSILQNGVLLRQIGYGDIFPLTNGGVIERNERRYYGFIPGNYPIILLALHEGYIIPSFAKVLNRRSTDLGTIAFAEKLANTIYETSGRRLFPTVMYSKLHRSRCDLNRSIEEAKRSELAYEVHRNFHNILKRMVTKWRKRKKRVLIIDIHGTKRGQYDAYLRYRRKRHEFLKPFFSILRKQGLKIRRSTPQTTRLPYGLYTLKRYDKGRGGVIVVQVELSMKLRVLENIDQIARIFNDALRKLVL